MFRVELQHVTGLDISQDREAVGFRIGLALEERPDISLVAGRGLAHRNEFVALLRNCLA